MSDTQHVGPLSAEQLSELRLVVDEERTSYDGTPFAKLGFWPSKVDALLNALAAAEARATEAAAEAGKWQAEATELQKRMREERAEADKFQLQVFALQRTELRLLKELKEAKAALTA